jgi:ribosomal-protein-alanine N-acetyltransferase
MVSNYKEVLYNIKTVDLGEITLRRHTPQDANDLLEYASDPEAIKYLDWEGVTNLEEASMRIFDRLMPDYGDFAIEYKQTKKYIGSIGLHVDYNNKKAVIGYSIHKQFWGRGYTTIALKSILDIGFNKLNLNRIEAIYNDNNHASGRVMEKCGMKKEVVSPQSKLLKGKCVDVTTYGLLKKDYLEESHA